MAVPTELTTSLNNFITVATGLGLLVCTLFLVFAGFSYMTSGGNPTHIERAKAAALNAAIGFAIILSANVLARLIQSAVVH